MKLCLRRARSSPAYAAVVSTSANPRRTFPPKLSRAFRGVTGGVNSTGDAILPSIAERNPGVH